MPVLSFFLGSVSFLLPWITSVFSILSCVGASLSCLHSALSFLVPAESIKTYFLAKWKGGRNTFRKSFSYFLKIKFFSVASQCVCEELFSAVDEFAVWAFVAAGVCVCVCVRVCVCVNPDKLQCVLSFLGFRAEFCSSGRRFSPLRTIWIHVWASCWAAERSQCFCPRRPSGVWEVQLCVCVCVCVCVCRCQNNHRDTQQRVCARRIIVLCVQIVFHAWQEAAYVWSSVCTSVCQKIRAPGPLGPWGPGGLGAWGPGAWGPGGLGAWGPGLCSCVMV